MVFEEPNSGLEYRYRRDDGLQVDVFLYPLAPQGLLCSGRCAEDAAGTIVEEFRRSIPAFIERGYVDTMTPLQETTMSVSKGSWLHTGRHLVMRIVRQGEDLDSHLYAFTGREAILKVRASYPRGDFLAAAVDSFVTLLLPLVPAPFDCALGLNAEAGVTVATTQRQDAERVVRALDSLLLAGDLELDYRAPWEGRWRTVPHFDRLPADGTVPTPGVVLFATVSATDDSTTVAITTQNACRSARAGKDGSNSVAGMILGLSLMNELNAALKVDQ